MGHLLDNPHLFIPVFVTIFLGRFGAERFGLPGGVIGFGFFPGKTAAGIVQTILSRGNIGHQIGNFFLTLRHLRVDKYRLQFFFYGLDRCGRLCKHFLSLMNAFLRV